MSITEENATGRGAHMERYEKVANNWKTMKGSDLTQYHFAKINSFSPSLLNQWLHNDAQNSPTVLRALEKAEEEHSKLRKHRVYKGVALF